jgi:hypothetical protein
MTTPTPDLFEITLDANGRLYLKDAARWGKILAITGLVFCVLLLAFGFWLLSIERAASVVPGWHVDIYPPDYFLGAAIQFVFPVFYIFPCLLLLRFSNRTLKALRENNGDLMVRSLRSMRTLYRWSSILLILGIVLCLLAPVVATGIIRIFSRTG